MKNDIAALKKEVESETTETLRTKAKVVLKAIHEAVRKREFWMAKRKEQIRKLQEQAEAVYAAYETGDCDRIDAIAAEVKASKESYETN